MFIFYINIYKRRIQYKELKRLHCEPIIMAEMKISDSNEERVWYINLIFYVLFFDVLN